MKTSKSRVLCILALVVSAGTLALVLNTLRPVGPGSWLTGSPLEKFDTLAYHQRGLDQAMWEIGYRFRELAWAGEQQDWDYARYQVDKIALTLEQAIQRRPARAENTRLFLEEGIYPLRIALDHNPRDNFGPRFNLLMAACVNCHSREEAPIKDLNLWMRTNLKQSK